MLVQVTKVHTCFLGISDEEIEERYEYENLHPEIVILADATIVKGMNVLLGMPKGGTLPVRTDTREDAVIVSIGPSHPAMHGTLRVKCWLDGEIITRAVAEIGSMRVYQEIDALRTMNINPIHYLVLPRIIAISIAFSKRVC